MAFIDWSEDYATGIDILDQQHRHLVDLVNKLHEASDRGRKPIYLNEIFNDLVGYTQEHFAREETMMADAGYPEARKHQDGHRKLIQDIEFFQYQCQTQGKCASLEVQEFLRGWLTDHLRSEDRALAAHLSGKTTGSPA